MTDAVIGVKARTPHSSGRVGLTRGATPPLRATVRLRARARRATDGFHWPGARDQG